jgi:hypothetical protein
MNSRNPSRPRRPALDKSCIVNCTPLPWPSTTVAETRARSPRPTFPIPGKATKTGSVLKATGSGQFARRNFSQPQHFYSAGAGFKSEPASVIDLQQP